MNKKTRKILDASMIVLAIITVGMFIGFSFVSCLYAQIIPGIISIGVLAYAINKLVTKIKNNKQNNLTKNINK